MRFFAGLLMGFLWFGGALLSQGHAADTTTIVTFGDSLFAGYGLPPDQSFPVQLEKRLTEKGYRVKIVNHGINGDTTSGGLSRVTHVMAENPQIVILDLGGNDVMRGISPAIVQDNLYKIMSQLHAAGIKMVLAGNKAPVTLGLAYAEAFNPIYPNLAKAFSVPLYPEILAGVYDVPGMTLADGLHPSVNGIKVMVDGIAPVIEPLLTK
jgi:acyl-CoA thioesterase I